MWLWDISGLQEIFKIVEDKALILRIPYCGKGFF
jgi:hypothetical protein